MEGIDVGDGVEGIDVGGGGCAACGLVDISALCGHCCGIFKPLRRFGVSVSVVACPLLSGPVMCHSGDVQEKADWRCGLGSDHVYCITHQAAWFLWDVSTVSNHSPSLCSLCCLSSWSDALSFHHRFALRMHWHTCLCVCCLALLFMGRMISKSV